MGRDNVSIRLLDITGKSVALVYNGQVVDGQNKFALSKMLPSGIYFVEVNGEKTNLTEKIILLQ